MTATCAVCGSDVPGCRFDATGGRFDARGGCCDERGGCCDCQGGNCREPCVSLTGRGRLLRVADGRLCNDTVPTNSVQRTPPCATVLHCSPCWLSRSSPSPCRRSPPSRLSASTMATTTSTASRHRWWIRLPRHGWSSPSPARSIAAPRSSVAVPTGCSRAGRSTTSTRPSTWPVSSARR